MARRRRITALSAAAAEGRPVALRDVVGLPLPNEHSARLRDPADFDPDTFRRVKDGTIYGSKKVPETAAVIWGKLKGKAEPDDPVLPQALRFPTEHWTADEAKKWLKDNDIEPIRFEPAEPPKDAERTGGRETITLRQPGALAADGFKVDREAGILRGVSVIARGPAVGHNFVIDDVMLGQVEAAINGQARGIRCRLTHAGTASPLTTDGIMELVGRVRRARRDDGRVRADLHFGRYADDSPRGRLKTYLMGIAEEDPEAIGLSVLFERAEFEEQKDPKTGLPLPPLGRIKHVVFIDFTDDPAANPSGLLSNPRGGGEPPHPQEDTLMKPELRAFLEKCGLKKDATLEEALAFQAKLPADQKAEAEKLAAPPPADPPKPAVVAPPAPDAEALAKKAAEEAAVKAVALERKRTGDLQALAKKEGLGAAWAERMIQTGRSVEDATALAADIKAAIAERAPLAVSVGPDLGRESLRPAMADAILLRAGIRLRERDRDTGVVKDRKPHERAVQFRGMRLAGQARFHLSMLGEPVEGLSDSQIAALVFHPRIRHLALAQGTSDFPMILEDAGNKTLLVAYEEAAPIWPLIARRATAPDFKTVRRIRRGEFGNLPIVVEHGEYTLVKVAEKKESYVLVKRGYRYALTWETIVNDDLDAFGTVLVDMGAGARRTEDAVTIAVVTGNAKVADGKALFHLDHGNLAADGDEPSIATLNAAFSAMGRQKGLSADAYLNIEPAVIAAPQGLRGTVTTLLTSAFDPATDKGHVRNIYQGRLREAYHAALDGPDGDVVAWYLFADPARLPAIEVCFLEGFETPTLTEVESPGNDGREYRVRHVVAAAPVEHRAAYCNPGE